MCKAKRQIEEIGARVLLSMMKKETCDRCVCVWLLVSDAGWMQCGVNEPVLCCAVKGVEQVGSVRHVEMLFRTNLIAIVGGGTNPKYADNTGTLTVQYVVAWWLVINK